MVDGRASSQQLLHNSALIPSGGPEQSRVSDLRMEQRGGLGRSASNGISEVSVTLNSSTDWYRSAVQIAVMHKVSNCHGTDKQCVRSLCVRLVWEST